MTATLFEDLHPGAVPSRAPAGRRIEFEESCNPPRTGHHAKKIVRIRGKGVDFVKLADKPELVSAKNFWDAVFLRHRPAQPLCGPLRVVLELTWPWNTSDSARKRAQGRVWHDTAPDWDNLAKTLIDSAARCALLVRDSMIVDGRVLKFRGDRPGIRVVLEEVG